MGDRLFGLVYRVLASSVDGWGFESPVGSS